MSSTYSWSFDAIPSNIDGIPVGWATSRGHVLGRLLNAILHVCIKTHRLRLL